jgi:hypothetical protein
MPPFSKLLELIYNFNCLVQPKSCCFCSFTKIHKHGTYFRKGTHEAKPKSPPGRYEVQRYLCLSSSCKRTFGQLPPDLLPYCRFRLKEILQIARLQKVGLSAYAIWKKLALWLVSAKAIKRVLNFISRLILFVQDLCRENDIPVSLNLCDLFQHLFGRYTWFSFTTKLYHAFYPKRLWSLESHII